MPNINLSNVEENDMGGFEHIEPGGYVLVVRAVEDCSDRQHVKLVWDVAEGPRKGAYAKSSYPPKDTLSWKETALPMLKHKLHVLADCNPGFDAEGAFQRDDWTAFSGKVFGAVVRKYLYTRDDGTPGERVEIGAWKRVDEIREGKWRPMGPRDQRKPEPAPVAAPSAEAVAAAQALADDDLPF